MAPLVDELGNGAIATTWPGAVTRPLDVHHAELVGRVVTEAFGRWRATPHQEHLPARVVRRLLEVTVATLALLLFAVLLPFIAMAIRLDSEGPVLFRQPRVGANGRVFTIYKLRSMVRDAEAHLGSVAHLDIMGGNTFKAPNDPRVTRVGRWLRRCSLDEVPQFFNVLRGDMALVGPRPPIVDEYHRYTPEERERMRVRPGLTGLWQVSGRNQRMHHEMIALDLEYAHCRSLWLDVVILLRTVPAMLRGRGAY